MAEDESVGRTMKAAHMALAEGRRVIIKAGELIEARFARGASPSLAARKVLALLIEKASGDAWRPGAHSITKKELRGSHESNDRLNDTLDELMSVYFKMPTISARGRDAVLTKGLGSRASDFFGEDPLQSSGGSQNPEGRTLAAARGGAP